MTTHVSPSHALPRVQDLLCDQLDVAEVVILPGGLQGYAIPHPDQVFTTAVQNSLYSALVPISSLAFGIDTAPYWRQRRLHDYFGKLSEFVVIADTSDSMVGWTGHSALVRNAYTNLYIDSSGLIPTCQSRGVMRALMRERLNYAAFPRHASCGTLYLSARSESPVFYKLMRGILGHGQLYPHGSLPTPVDVLECGRNLAEWLGQIAILEPRSLILRGAYAILDALYENLPSTGNVQLDRLFHAQLGPVDAYLLIGQVDVTTPPNIERR